MRDGPSSHAAFNLMLSDETFCMNHIVILKEFVTLHVKFHLLVDGQLILVSNASI